MTDQSRGSDPDDTASPDPGTADKPAVVRGSGDRAVAAAVERAKHTSDRNIPTLPDLPLPEDTANLRLGPNLNDELLALLPLVGVWRGEGEGDNAELGSHHFGQQIVISHDGGNYLIWESRSWLLDESGDYVRPTLRESGFWRIGDDDVIEFVLTHSSGVVELFYGAPLNQSSWEIATDVVIRSSTGPQYGGAKRLYGIVEGGDLAYVEERIQGDGEMRPHLSARLQRYAG